MELPQNDGLPNGAHGAIEIKLAWKQLDPTDDASRFYTHWILVTPSEPNAQPVWVHVGLVGMHISMRTQSSPEWIWATFEQIDNVRSNPESDGKMSKPSFVDPNYTGTAFNTLPPKNAFVDSATGAIKFDSGPDANTWAESLTTTPTQVKRIVVPTQPNLNPWDDDLGRVTAELNKEVQALLQAQGSVFQNYELIDVQWPLHPSYPAVAGGSGSAPESIRYKTRGEMVPTFLINTTMETFFQGGEQPAGPTEQDNRISVPTTLLSDAGNQLLKTGGSGNVFTDPTSTFNGTESCVGCHYSSGITIGFRYSDSGGPPAPIYGENNHGGDTGSANFSWMLQQEPQAELEKAASK